jgi:hypothetical protein
VFCFRLPNLDSQENDQQQAGHSKTAEDNPGDGHAFAAQAKGIAANLTQRQVAEDERGERA